jgi:hypothetical protein
VARIIAFAHAVEGVVEASDFRRVRPDLGGRVGKSRRYRRILAYQGSHVSSVHSQAVDVLSRVERRAAPSGRPPLRLQKPVRPRDPVASPGAGGPKSRSRQGDWEAPRNSC